MAMSKTNKLLNALKEGDVFTARQAARRFNFSGPNSVTGIITDLRDDGVAIETLPPARKGANCRYAIPA